jgi:hypothetical protein
MTRQNESLLKIRFIDSEKNKSEIDKNHQSDGRDGERISEVILLFDEEEGQFATARTCLVLVVKNNTYLGHV